MVLNIAFYLALSRAQETTKTDNMIIIVMNFVKILHIQTKFCCVNATSIKNKLIFIK